MNLQVQRKGGMRGRREISLIHTQADTFVSFHKEGKDHLKRSKAKVCLTECICHLYRLSALLREKRTAGNRNARGSLFFCIVLFVGVMPFRNRSISGRMAECSHTHTRLILPTHNQTPPKEHTPLVMYTHTHTTLTEHVT